MEDQNPYRTTSIPSSSASLSPPPQRAAASRALWLQAASLILAAIGGALVWGLSPLLTGELEPWDSRSGYYGIGIAVASALSGLLAGRQLWLPIIGTYLGQVIYCLLFYHPGGPVIMPIAISAGLFGVIPAVIGAGIGAVPNELYRTIGGK